MVTHTPGPWEANKYDEVWAGHEMVATCYGADDANASERVQANARLITAAPDLASALLGLLAATTHDCGCEEEQHLKDHLWPAQMCASEALAKAEGR